MIRFVPLTAFFLCYGVSVLYYYHMFQLSSYRAAGLLQWLRKNLLTGYFQRVPACITMVGMLFVGEVSGCLLVGLCFVVQGVLNWPKKAKKPLVFTPRVKRMLVTNGVLLAALAGASTVWLGIKAQMGCLILAFLLTPFWVLLSNWINAPMEKAINRWYIDDAKRMIREAPNLIVIGITGSYGKTSTKYFLHKLLSAKYNVLMTPESFNTTLGVVKTIRGELRPVHDIFLCEMGAKGVGEIKEICDIVHPRYGIITSIGPQHLETFGSIENVVRTKFELADAVPAEGAVFLNYDNEFIRENPCERTVIRYGAAGDWDYRGGAVRGSDRGVGFSVRFPDGTETEFETKLIGMHNVQNLVGCVAVADYLGVPRKDLAIGVRRLESVPHRLQLIQRGGDIIIDDAFNSNTAGAKAALDALGLFDGYKILVTPGMIELGEDQDRYNRQFGTQAAAVCDYVILVGKRQTESIHEGLRDAGYDEGSVYVADTIQDAFARMGTLQTAGRKKVILLENDLPDNY